LTSPNGRYRLVLQPDGNLVLMTEQGRPLWDAGTHGHDGARAVMQRADGNLVVYGSDGSALWNAGVTTSPDATLVVQDDGNLVIYGARGAVWASGTVNGGLGPDERLQSHEYLSSPNGEYRLTMQEDGNLVLTARDGRVIWATMTDGHPGASLVMQAADGNLVVYDGGTPLWNSGTAGNPGAVLAVQDDANLVIYSSHRVAWTSNTSTSRAQASSSAGGEEVAKTAEARIGEVTQPGSATPWSGWCERFVEQVYGNRFNFGSAINHYYHRRNLGQVQQGVPPRGAIVFYGGAQGFGHVGIGVGSGEIVSTVGYSGERKPVARNSYTYFQEYLGWAMPY
jgi:hypothetical protein